MKKLKKLILEYRKKFPHWGVLQGVVVFHHEIDDPEIASMFRIVSAYGDTDGREIVELLTGMTSEQRKAEMQEFKIKQ